MKNVLAFGALAISSFFVLGCEEIPPKIIPCQTERVVLVEEFTGIDCVNCPQGSEKIELLSSQNPGKIIAISIHAGFFAVNHQGFDLKCPDGIALESSYLGPVSGYPAATINRKVYSGESSLITGILGWAGYIGTEKCNRPIAELAMTTTYDSQDSIATVTVNMTPSIYFVDALAENLAMTVLITESNIIGYQKTPDGGVNNYSHKHVLRDVITTEYTGDILIGKGNKLSPQQKVITNYKIPAGWNPDNCHVVAFIHYKGDKNKEVLQAIEKELK